MKRLAYRACAVLSIAVVMFPVMVWAYGRLARREEADLEREFGAAYRRYAEQTPAFIPTWGNPPAHPVAGGKSRLTRGDAPLLPAA